MRNKNMNQIYSYTSSNWHVFWKIAVLEISEIIETSNIVLM